MLLNPIFIPSKFFPITPVVAPLLFALCHPTLWECASYDITGSLIFFTNLTWIPTIVPEIPVEPAVSPFFV